MARWLEGRAVRYFVPKPDEGVWSSSTTRYVNGLLRVEDRRYVRIGEAPRLIGADALSRALSVRSGIVRLVAGYAFVNVSRPLVVVGRDEVCIGLGTALTALLKAGGVGTGLTVVEYGGELSINASASTQCT